jgi:hypothetical protein
VAEDRLRVAGWHMQVLEQRSDRVVRWAVTCRPCGDDRQTLAADESDAVVSGDDGEGLADV